MKHEKGIQEQIVRWMAAKILGEPLSAGEERALGMWLAESEEHVRLFERIRGGEAVREMLRLRSGESTTPRTNPSQSGSSFSQVSIISTPFV